MNRMRAWISAAVILAVIAVFDLVSAWPIHTTVVLFVLTLGLFGTAIALFIGLVVAGFGERRRIVAGAANSLDLVRRAARSVRLSALAAVAFGIFMFANCSGGVLVNDRGPMDDIPGFLTVGAEVLLPVLLVIALVAALATVAEQLANRGRWQPARRMAQAAVWSAVAVSVVALLTVPVAIIFGVSYCDFGTSAGACAAGVAGIGNVFLTGTVALLLPYILVLVHALEAASSPQAGSVPTAEGT
jgi:hypothetical protein